MTESPTARLLTINTGSSSLKAAIYEMAADSEQPILSADIQRIALPGGSMRIVGTQGEVLLDQEQQMPDHAAALESLLGWIGSNLLEKESISTVGHRVVHGGSAYSAPQRITPEVLATLHTLIPLAPNHEPQAIAAIETVEALLPDVPQVACFDTAFHRRMPPVAQSYALPRQVRDAGVVRYGFHGLSYEYILQELGRLDPAAAAGRAIIAHLGNGASMAAVLRGKSVDTTMGFTPAGGLVMGTRPGDLDPGIVVYLLETGLVDAVSMNDLINRRSGLLGISECSADMQDLLEREGADPKSAKAVELFCYQARKFVGALAAVLGGLETLVFTGGIGEHAAPVRERICSGLEFLGTHLDPDRNASHADIISTEGGPVVVRVMRTDEDLMIARHTYELLRGGGT